MLRLDNMNKDQTIYVWQEPDGTMRAEEYFHKVKTSGTIGIFKLFATGTVVESRTLSHVKEVLA